VGVFASNVHRLRLLGDIAHRHGRKVVALGRSVALHARVARTTARATGAQAGKPYLEWPSEMVWPAARVAELPRGAILGIATGTQGEEMAALARLGRGEHPALGLGAGDIVAMSSRVIPGNEGDVMLVVSSLLRRGVELRTCWSDPAVHVSGHAHRAEQRRMIELVRPKAFVPVHGTLHHLSRHAALARELGVAEVCVLENGEVGELGDDDRQPLRKTGRVQVGRIHVFAHRMLPANVVRERSALAGRGAAHVVVPIDDRGRLVAEIALSTYGVVDEAIEAAVLEAARSRAREAIDELTALGAGETSTDAIAQVARRAVRRTLEAALGFRPATTVAVLRIPR